MTMTETQEAVEARLAGILNRAGEKGRSWRTVAHSPLLDALYALESRGRVHLVVDEDEHRPGRFRACAVAIGAGR